MTAVSCHPERLKGVKDLIKQVHEILRASPSG